MDFGVVAFTNSDNNDESRVATQNEDKVSFVARLLSDNTTHEQHYRKRCVCCFRFTTISKSPIALTAAENTLKARPVFTRELHPSAPWCKNLVVLRTQIATPAITVRRGVVEVVSQHRTCDAICSVSMLEPPLAHTPPVRTICRVVVEVPCQTRLCDAKCCVYTGAAPRVHGAQASCNTAVCMLEPPRTRRPEWSAVVLFRRCANTSRVMPHVR